MNNQVDIIIESLWKKYNKKFNTQDYDKESFLKALYNSPPAIIEKNISLLNPWLSILDECLFWLYLHKEFFEKQFQSEKQDELRGVFLLTILLQFITKIGYVLDERGVAFVRNVVPQNEGIFLVNPLGSALI